VPEPQIDECDIEMISRGFGDGIFGVADGDDIVAVGFEADGQRLADVDFIIHDQNAQR
jgi:hypothetical protein